MSLLARPHFPPALQISSGIAPVRKQSGKHESVHVRWACPKFLRQTFHEFAAFSVRQSVWAGAFYKQKREQGKDHHAAVRALAFKWIRILYRCWQDSKPYEESRYLAALRRRGSPLVRDLPVSVESLWATILRRFTAQRLWAQRF